ncbi:MAG: hypothetical protein Q3996_00375 [Candidatus Saccharibacteria bacterium]|nr:hypothetical protein [Candidatus Saccharibacteria bacterium]
MTDYYQSLDQLRFWENRSQISDDTDNDVNQTRKKSTNYFRFKPGSKPKNFKKIIPIISLSMLLLLAGIAVLIVSLPGLLINHFVQTFVDRYDTDQTSLNARANLMLDNLFTSQPTNSRYAEINQRRQISDNLIKNLESQGFHFDIQNKQIRAVWFKNQPINKADFLNQLQTNVAINEAKNVAFLSKRIVFQDQAWQHNANNLGLSKAGFKKPESSDHQKIIEDYRKQENDLTKINEYGLRFNTTIPTTKDEQGNEHEIDTPNANLLRSLTNNLTYINQQADKLSEKNQTPFQQKFDNLKLVETDFISNQSACGAYQNSIFLQDYAKTKQASQQAKFALNLAIESDKIKAGVATPEAVEYYGNRLTKTFQTVKNDGTIIKTKAATDSIGYKYAAYGDAVIPDDNTERYILGATPTTNQLISDTNQQHCNSQSQTSFLSNFFANILNFLNPFKLNLSTNFDNNSSRKLTENTLAAMSNRHVDSETAGEDFGNAAAAGFGAFLGRNAARGGSGVLTKRQAVAFLNEQDKRLAMQAKIDQKNLNPFDTSSKYTFLGSIVYHNLSLLSQVSSLLTFSANFLKSVNYSLATINPISQATSSTKTYNSLSNCQDSTYAKLNQYLTNGEEIALDVFCNPVYGTSTTHLNLSTEEVINRLIASGDLALADPNCTSDCQLVRQNGLADYEKNCVNRGNLPIGNSENGFDDGASCLQNSEQKALYAIYFIDNRLQQIFNQLPLL